MQNTTVTRDDIADWVPIIPSCEIIADPNPPARDETNWAKESDARLVRLAHQGLKRRLRTGPGRGRPADSEAYIFRLDYELTALQQADWARHLLVAHAFAAFAHNRGIAMGCGIGSIAGSLVAWALGITELDPLAHGLIFERFFDATHAPPTIAMDFDLSRFDEMVDFALGRLTQPMGAPFPALEYSGVTVRPGMNDRNQAQPAWLVRPFFESVAGGRRAVDLTLRQARERGLATLTLHGMPAITTIEGCVAAANSRLLDPDQGDLNAAEIPLDDPGAMDLLAGGDAIDVFQVDNDLFRQALENGKPRSLDDVAALLALARPLTIEAGVMKDWLRGGAPDEPLTSLLKETRGVLVYQEQVATVAAAVTGCTMQEGERLRRTLLLRDTAIDREEACRFEHAAEARGVPATVARDIFNCLAHGTPMTFNRSHAIACALLTYRAAWLKQHHPTEYAAAYDAAASLARGWRPACCNPAAGSAVVPVDQPQGTCPTN
jgi:DNA polymerase III alpha subunit